MQLEILNFFLRCVLKHIKYPQKNSGILINFQKFPVNRYYIYLFGGNSHYLQGRNHEENIFATPPMVGRIFPPVWNRVKVSENLGATPVAHIPDLYLGFLKFSDRSSSPDSRIL